MTDDEWIKQAIEDATDDVRDGYTLNVSTFKIRSEKKDDNARVTALYLKTYYEQVVLLKLQGKNHG